MEKLIHGKIWWVSSMIKLSLESANRNGSGTITELNKDVSHPGFVFSTDE